MRSPRHLRHSQDDKPGYTRKRHVEGFVYFDDKGKQIVKQSVIARLNRLAIPPAWEQVWICKDRLGCLQASGRDQRGRKQYIYHPDWALYRNLDKFQNLFRFGEDLAKIRAQLWQDIALPAWPKQKVVAMAIAVMDETYIRVGNRRYVEANQTYGLTTLRRKHMEVNAGKLLFSFRAKGGQYREVSLQNRRLCKLIQACAELPGYELFCYLDEEGKSHPIVSQDVNVYLEAVTGAHYTAKDFRTWGGSVTALEVLPEAKLAVAENPKLNLINAVIRGVTRVLGNTVAICRKYYIHPAVLSAIELDNTERYLKLAEAEKNYVELELTERQLMLLLKDYYK